MEQTKKNTSKHWIMFAFWTIVLFAIMFSPWGQWFWLVLPFVCTQLAKALDLI